MEIKFYGHACFSVEDQGVKVVLDPFSDDIGLKLPSTLKADVVTVSQNNSAHNGVKSVQGEPRVFSWPGEYETRGVHFRCIHSFGLDETGASTENNIAVLHFNGIKLCHLGGQIQKLTPEQLEQIGDIDLLFVPVASKNASGSKKTKDLIEQIEPRIVIPMMYSTEGNKLDLNPLSTFLSEMAATHSEPLASFKIKKTELPEDNTKVIILNVSE